MFYPKVNTDPPNWVLPQHPVCLPIPRLPSHFLYITSLCICIRKKHKKVRTRKGLNALLHSAITGVEGYDQSNQAKKKFKDPACRG
jgi:hypothetical protein